MKSKNKLRNHRSLVHDAVRGNMDAKVSQAEIMLEYAFDRDVNFKERMIRISGPINSKAFRKFDSAMTELESQGRKTITIKINSPGGEVYQALAIIGRIKNSPCNVITEGYGEIMSAATLVLASGDKRRVSKYAFFMHHEASYTVEGRQSEIEASVKQAKSEDLKWCEWMAEFSKKKKEYWLKSGVHVDAYFTPEELLELGVVDEIF